MIEEALRVKVAYMLDRIYKVMISDPKVSKKDFINIHMGQDIS